MDEVSGSSLPPSRNASRRTKPPISTRDGSRGERSAKSSPTPRASQANPLRTASAPPVPPSKDSGLSTIDNDSDASNQRDSVASIKDDPFFRNYQTPRSVSLARELRSATISEQSRDEDLANNLPPRSPHRPSAEKTASLLSQSRSAMAEINIAIIGSSGVGKSTLIQRALGLRTLPSSITTSLRMSVDNVVYTVSLIELDLESFDINTDRRIQWPKQINGHIVPRMDGSLLLYDVMNRESILALPQTLNALVNSALPTILVSCKCDNPENTRQIDVESMEAACLLQCVEAVKTASNVPESARLCLSSMLRAIMKKRNGPLIEPPGPRRRATSSAHLQKPADSSPGRPLSQQSNKHSRASSEYSIGRGFSAPPPVPSRGLPPLSRSNGRNQGQHQFTLPDPHEAPPLSAHPAFRQESPSESVPPASRSPPGHPPRSPLPSPRAKMTIDSSYLNVADSDTDSPSNRYADDTPILQRNDDTFFDRPAKVLGVPFDELVDRLLTQNMSRADENFADIFLCLYRKFAAPGELFAAILGRLDHIAEDKNIQYLTRTTSQLRIIAIVAKWVSSYPGDFASPSTRHTLDTFINNLSTEPVFAAAAQDMRLQLQSRVVEDDDTGWARTDADVILESETASESTQSSPVRKRTNANSSTAEGMSKLQLEDDFDELNKLMERKESVAESNISGQSIAQSFHSVEDYEREAATMVPKGTLALTKFRYHIFMDTSDDDFADEMTRIDWVMFSAVRLRDLVRHVSLSVEQKDKCKSLTNVNRMTGHFNHIAKWVANMILLREKPKHRALTLQKFMAIALKLRQLNNYNGLAAVMAGINSSAIHRLTQTKALVPVDVQKRFARLVLLMGAQKSHFAYRLAWENSSLPRIPYIPLCRRDLVSAEEGSLTFVGANGRINWKKFEVLSEVILPIMKSQIQPYPNLTKHDVARELILDCHMPTDEEEIYQRSLKLETSTGSADFGKKKFPWFQKDR